MKDLFMRVEDFLFDIIGLVLPGMVFFIVIVGSVRFFIDLKSVMESFKITVLLFNKYVVFLFFVVFFYLIGHVVKVFAIIEYEFLSFVFDDFVNIYVKKILHKFPSKIRTCFTKGVPEKLKKITYNTVGKVFVFKPQSYFEENKDLQTQCIKMINDKLGSEYPNNWYSIYKLSSIINIQEKTKSLANNFLAKYNLYRSLSFIFSGSIVFNYILECHCCLLSGLEKWHTIFLYSMIIMWFTFHYKYKRYWTLCGNETLVFLYYFLNREKLK